MLFLLDSALPEGTAGGHLITPELMDGMGLPSGGPKRFASTRQRCVIRLARRGVPAARLLSTPALRLRAHKKRGQDRVEVPGLTHRQHRAVRPLARQALSAQPEARYQ